MPKALSVWFNKELNRQSLAGEDKQDFRAKIETLGKNVVQETAEEVRHVVPRRSNEPQDRTQVNINRLI